MVTSPFQLGWQAEADTPEGIAAAKERARRAQEESDLELAKEAFGK